jgi:hypothetical protein
MLPAERMTLRVIAEKREARESLFYGATRGARPTTTIASTPYRTGVIDELTITQKPAAR